MEENKMELTAARVRILIGDCRERLREMPDASVQCVVTSPPYFGLRDYGHEGQIGLEDAPDSYVQRLVEVFREVRRVLCDDGTLWLNLGDSYAGAGYSNHRNTGGAQRGDGGRQKHLTGGGLKNKDLIGIPWRVAFALQADGWCLRQDIIWHKPNAMPESVRDRCTNAHEYIFLFTKSPRYFYDQEAIKEPASTTKNRSGRGKYHLNNTMGAQRLALAPARPFRNRRSVWTIPTKPFKGAHFATFPPELAETCIKAGTKPGDMVLDPFGGAGTTGLVADQLGRDCTLIELNPEYAEMARKRIANAKSGN